ncbi:MAG: undecaprenyl/decaprenyl-phosphate alpha-N-acetylglucosaminyl 1-phosphate transferase [Anaerolineae bacterium]|nr:undecaprenyl/decaprenyl-phosphate alpha-N-acetylglucosaminyl 1-phosphate transferase [Anaerolineae bacterium]
MEFTDYTYIFVYLLLGVILSLFVGHFAILVTRRWGLIDVPGVLPHKQHKSPTPLAGGLTLIVCLILLIPVDGIYRSTEISRILLPLLIIFLFGLWDDKKRIRARYKLVGQVLAALVLIISGISVQVFESLVGPNSVFFQAAMALDVLITLLWVVGVTNAYNLIDSMDGLAIGLANLAFTFFVLASIISEQSDLIVVFSALLGISVGISLYNASPAKMFLGDSGAQSLGFLLAVLGICYTPLDKAQASTWLLPVMLVLVPIFDTSLVFFSRLRHGMPFYVAGRDHMYHRLVDMGVSSGRAVMIIQITALIVNCLGFIAVSLPWVYSNIIYGFTLLVALGAFIYFETVVKKKITLS